MATRSVAPRGNGEGGIGTTLLRWATGFINVLTVTTINLLTLAKASVGFTISGGDTSKTLTVDETSSMSSKENSSNKSTNVITDAASDAKYPSVKAIKDYADGLVVGLIDDRGNYNASGNAWPTTGGSGTAGAILKGDLWYISIAGTLGGVLVSVGSSIRALVDTPGSTAGNWDILNVGLGYAPENIANRRTSFQGTPDDTHYPSEKLVKDSLGGKVDHSLAIAENDVLVGAPTPFGSWVKKTIAEFKTILGLGTAAYTAATAYATSTQGGKADSALQINPALGTPASGTLTNCGGYPTANNAEALAGVDTVKIITSSSLRDVLDKYQPNENLIGIPGTMGFGVGICPAGILPPGMHGMPGYDILGSDNYGNYVFTEGSVMIWVPRFYYRVGNASNPTYGTYGVNSIDIKGLDTYATTTLANAAGYALHRSFIDGGVEKQGFFRDKYKCSKVANGTGYTAASIKNGLPLSSAAAHNPFSGLTGGADYYYSALDLAHRRDGVNGDVNASSIFFCSSQFLRGAIAMLSMAHGQAATSTANCAWYHATYNYPKGCNNNALADCDDTTVIWVTDGYSNCGKTGSAGSAGGAGNVFAKSTHNGQNCGSADDNGLMYEISIGVTCDGTNFYVAKQATAMKTFTNGDNAAATDHWGRYDMFDVLTVPFITGNDGWAYFGNGANQVLADDTSGNAWLLAGLGFPETADGLSAAGTNLFGKDGLYRYIINKMCLIVAGYWYGTSSAGVRGALFDGIRDDSYYYVGFRAACYHV